MKSYRNRLKKVVSKLENKIKDNNKIKDKCVALGFDNFNNIYFSVSGGFTDYIDCDQKSKDLKNKINKETINDFEKLQLKLLTLMNKQGRIVTLLQLTDDCKTVFAQKNSISVPIPEETVKSFHNLLRINKKYETNINRTFSCVERKIMFNSKNSNVIVKVIVSKKPCNFCEPYTNKIIIRYYNW